jgi:hypothetical protein
MEKGGSGFIGYLYPDPARDYAQKKKTVMWLTWTGTGFWDPGFMQRTEMPVFISGDKTQP